jgi:hypothetical protein
VTFSDAGSTPAASTRFPFCSRIIVPVLGNDAEACAKEAAKELAEASDVIELGFDKPGLLLVRPDFYISYLSQSSATGASDAVVADLHSIMAFLIARSE